MKNLKKKNLCRYAKETGFDLIRFKNPLKRIFKLGSALGSALGSSLASEVFKACLDFIYPPLCLHCAAPKEKTSPIFCQTCLSLLQLLDPYTCCPLCFASEDLEKGVTCENCLDQKPPFHGLCAVFENRGPAATLLKKLNDGEKTYLAQGSAAYMVTQFLQMNWPLPDLVVPVPIPFLKRVSLGYNQNSILAHGIAELLQRPVADILKCKEGDEEHLFLLKTPGVISGKKILLVNDLLNTGGPFWLSGKALLQDHPDRLYGLTLCRP